MNESYVTPEAKANGILADRYPGKELEKLYATTRNQARRAAEVAERHEQR